MFHTYTGGRYAETGYSAYAHLHTPHYQPSSPSSSRSELENLLNPPPLSTLLLPSSQRQAPRQQPHTPHSRKAAKAPPRNLSILAALVADEEHIASRKSNLARFGSTWIRPPGVQKTKQTCDDEELEQREHDETVRREDAARDAREAQERLEFGQRAVAGDAAGDGPDAEVEGAEVERDLDDEVPVAEGNQDSEGDYEEREEGMDEEEQGERDLDEDVPEAGSYEHTDTEVEDSSDIDEPSEMGPPANLRPPGGLIGLDEHESPLSRASFMATPQSLGLDSSGVLSSPTAPRGRPTPGGRGR